MTDIFKNGIAKILIYSSKQTTINSGLISAATEKMSNSGLCRIANDITNLPANPTEMLLIIDGNEEEIGLRELQKAGITPNFHLIVSELGLSLTKDSPVTPEDLQLLIDAIEAACATPECTPKFNCPCSC